jgi:hypothetical protein
MKVWFSRPFFHLRKMGPTKWIKRWGASAGDMNRSSDDLLRDLSKLALDVLRQYRHDVMNDLQLIRGYVQMNKTESVFQSIQRAVEQSQKLSEFSVLPDALLGFVLLEAQIRFTLLNIETIGGLTAEDSNDAEAETLYPVAPLLRLRDVLLRIGTFAMQYDIKMDIDVDLSSPDSIRILVSGNNDGMDWMDRLESCFDERATKGMLARASWQHADGTIVWTIDLANGSGESR